MRVVAAPDKFRGTATAPEVADAIGRAANDAGWSCDRVPLADGGEGLLDAFGGPNRTSLVAGPLGEPVEAAWRLHRGRAVIESALASGLLLVGGAEGNDPIAASSYGTGELITHAVEAGAKRVVVGVGGSAMTDGGLGALRAMYPTQRLRGVEIAVACDVRCSFVDAAEVFAPQKGASKAQVELLKRRLERLAQVYLEEHGVDVRGLTSAGAAGGLAGGLAVAGASLCSGFDLVSEEVGFEDVLEGADLVVTGEGFVDAQSYDGKVVGGVTALARELGVPVLVVAGQVFDDDDRERDDDSLVVSLTERFGAERSLHETTACVEEVVADHLRGLT
ncbi:MAG: glycerate kinase [Actinomycetota bacterium]|nr:glycerate kinase [Actinomycetota bacterium]